MEMIKYINDDCFVDFCKNISLQKREKAKFWGIVIAIIGVVIAAAALAVGVAALVVSCNAYNGRYDADATAAGGIEFTFQSNGNDSGSGSFTATVGQITYGYFQSEGVTPTEYTLFKKISTSSNYTTLKNFTIYSNNNYTGDFSFAYNSKSAKYDVKCQKNNNKSTKSVFEFDWGI